MTFDDNHNDNNDFTHKSLLSNNCNLNSLSTISKFDYCVHRLLIFIVKLLLINLTFCALVKVGFKNNTMTTNFVLMVMIFKGVIEAKEEVAEL